MEVHRLLLEELPADLCETDLAFASGNEKFRLQVFSPRAAACLEAEKRRGLLFEPVSGRAEGFELEHEKLVEGLQEAARLSRASHAGKIVAMVADPSRWGADADRPS